MKTKRYALLLCFFLPLLLLMAVEADAQRRPWRNGRVYHRPYYPVRTFAYQRPFVSVHFGGMAYRYQYGRFYRPYGTSFRMVMPPVGIRVSVLPPGYRRMYVGPQLYYYQNRTFYRSYGEREYEVVAPPLGAWVDDIPEHAKEVVIDGQAYFEADGTYFLEEENEEGELQYRVVGVDGVLDTQLQEEKENQPATTPTEAPKPAGPQIGDRFETLPANAKEVTIKGEKLFLSPAGFYYKKIEDKGEVWYEIVGN